MKDRFDQIDEHMTDLGYTMKIIADREIKIISYRNNPSYSILFIVSKSEDGEPLHAQIRFNNIAEPTQEAKDVLNSVSKEYSVTNAEYIQENGVNELRFESCYDKYYGKDYHKGYFHEWLNLFISETKYILNDENRQKSLLPKETIFWNLFYRLFSAVIHVVLVFVMMGAISFFIDIGDIRNPVYFIVGLAVGIYWSEEKLKESKE